MYAQFSSINMNLVCFKKTIDKEVWIILCLSLILTINKVLVGKIWFFCLGFNLLGYIFVESAHPRISVVCL